MFSAVESSPGPARDRVRIESPETAHALGIRFEGTEVRR
jgi:hypothetical protein